MSITSSGVSDWEKGDSLPGPRPATGPSGADPAHSIARVAYSIPETAKQLGVSEASVWRAVKRKDLESFMFGGRRLITARSINKAISGKAA